MTDSNDPDEIREQIERTRADLSDNVNALADSVNPAQVAGRQVEKVKGAVRGVKNKVMGGGDDPYAESRLSAAGSAVTGAPAQLTSQAKGNPLAAGVIAFGAGLLLASLLPTSAAEQKAATKTKEAATPMLGDAAKQMSGNLREPAQNAMDSVKGTATGAISNVKEQGTSAAQDVKDQAQDAKETVQEQ